MFSKLNIFKQLNLPWISRGMASSKAKDVIREKFGYGFNENGQLRKVDKKTGKLTEEGFDFNISKDHTKNQRNYEALGEILTDFVYDLLEEKGLHKIYVPDDIAPEEATFIFSTQKELMNPKKLLILIHGTGVVRAGQWARSLIINHSIDAGTVLPYVERAKSLGYEVIITNTNDNYRKGRPIPGNESPQQHAELVWQKFVKETNPESIAIVAHSYGGVVTTALSKIYASDFSKKVFAVALTDSVHSPYSVPERLKEIGLNFVTSTEKVGVPLKHASSDIPRASAGHTKHEMTSYSCMEPLFEFLENKYAEMFPTTSPDPKKMKTDL